MMGAVAEQGVERQQPLEIGADVELLGDAHAAMKLHRLFGDEARALADLGLRAGRGAAPRDRFGVGHQRGTQRHRARLVATHRHVRQPMADHLIGRERSAELLSHLGIVDRAVQQRLGDPDRLGAKRRKRAIDDGFDFRQDVLSVAEPRVGRQANVREVQIAGAPAA